MVQYFPVITGSLTVQGNVLITGSINTTAGITGSFSGTATTALTASSVANLNQNVVVTGSLTTTGQIVAQTLNVQQVTSSIVYSSGSNIFGNSQSNIQQFTGSLLVTGSYVLIGTTASNAFKFKVSNNGAEEIAMNPGDSTNTNSYVNYNRNTSAYITASYSAATHAFLQGSVGIGTSSPASILHTSFTNTTASISGTTPAGIGVSFGAGDGNNGGIWFSSLFGGDQGISGIAGIRTSGYQNELAFYTNNTNSARAFSERMRINNSGSIGIGTSTPTAPLTIAVPATGSAISATNAQTAYDYSRLRIKHYSDSNLGLSIGYAGANWTYVQACYNEGSTAPLLLNPYGGEVRVGTGGLKFANGSTALSYYEEGTFTPNNLNSNMSSVSPTFGRYVRIGNQVTINVRWNVNPGGTGQRYLVFNLPFAFSIANGVSYTGAVSNYNSGLSAYSSNVGTSVRNSSGSDTQQYVEAVFTSNANTDILFSMTYFTF